MADLKIEQWPIGKVLPYAKNSRLHSEAQIAAIDASIEEFGFINPCLVDANGVLIAGHGRVLALQRRKAKTVAVIRLGHLSDDQVKALRIADNALPLQATWSAELLGAEIASLRLSGFDVKLLGFTEAQLRGWNDNATPAKDPEIIPEAPKKPVVRKGDLWHLGEHRLICGDSTDPETWRRLLGTARASVVFTDPPYGVSYESGNRMKRDGRKAFPIIKGDKAEGDAFYRMLVMAFQGMANHSRDNAAFYIWHASASREDFAQAMKAAGLAERQYLIWVKPLSAIGWSDYQQWHEPCFYAAKGETKPSFYGGRAESTVWRVSMVRTKDVSTSIGNGILLLDGQGGTLFVQAKAPKAKKLRQIRIEPKGAVFLADDPGQSTVWHVGRDGQEYQHPTQKPVELARRAIENSSKPGEIVIDGFLGSGTTLIGAEMTGRRCFGAELDPVYAEVIIRRWERYTSKKATLERTTATTGKTMPPGATMKPSRKSGLALRQAGLPGRQKQKGGTPGAPLPPNRASEAL